MAASGATRLGGGGDVRVMGNTRLECKFTEKGSYTLRFIELQKVRKQAFKTLENPVLQFAFRHPSGRLTSYAVIPWVIGDKAAETDNSWLTSNASITFTERQLEDALLKGRIQFTFAPPGKEPLAFRLFEIMRWHDYVERQSVSSKEE